MPTTPQRAIFVERNRAHHYLEFALLPEAGDQEIHDALGRLLAARAAASDWEVVIALGPDLMGRLVPVETPPGLAAFAPIAGWNGLGVPAAQHDLWLWVQGAGPDVVLDGALAVAAALSRVTSVVVDQPAFTYRDRRDLTGFEDGTENPGTDEAPEVAVVPAGTVGSGGSFVLAMTYEHDLLRFHALPIAEQEAVIGRTKPDSVELDEATKPPSAHIARVVIEDDGAELEIYRRSTPFGGVGRHGLCFVAFSADPTRVTRMLDRMYGTAGDGRHDRLMEFTRATSGANYFAPSEETLAEIATR